MTRGSMCVLWKKTDEAAPVLRKIRKPIVGIKRCLEKAREELDEAQNSMI